MAEQVIELTELFAAAIASSPTRRIEISSEAMAKSYAGKVLAIDYDDLTDSYVVTLVEQDDVDLEDE